MSQEAQAKEQSNYEWFRCSGLRNGDVFIASVFETGTASCQVRVIATNSGDGHVKELQGCVVKLNPGSDFANDLSYVAVEMKCDAEDCAKDENIDAVYLNVAKTSATVASKKGKNKASFVFGRSPLKFFAEHPECFPNAYIDQETVKDVYQLLCGSKNVILQGPPGTGKTYLAKLIAKLSFGEDATEFVQFHQSYSYEDFVWGYRPNGSGGFDVKLGLFAELCREAEKDENKIHLLIIDEINRANISKVFGEALMLIEASHRGESVKLPFKLSDVGLDEDGKAAYRLTVPDNVYIIGCMNTADRGLADFDYALRRRFKFVSIDPCLKREMFPESMRELVDCVKELNGVIARNAFGFGNGFCIGHSYFMNNIDGEVPDKELVRKYDLEPLIEEYTIGDIDLRDEWLRVLRGDTRGESSSS